MEAKLTARIEDAADHLDRVSNEKRAAMSERDYATNLVIAHAFRMMASLSRALDEANARIAKLEKKEGENK